MADPCQSFRDGVARWVKKSNDIEQMLQAYDEPDAPKPKPGVIARLKAQLKHAQDQLDNQRRLLSRCEADLDLPGLLVDTMTGGPISARVIASKRVVQVGEPFSLEVAARSPNGLRSVGWSGLNTGISSLDQSHDQDADGARAFRHVWGWISLATPGTYRFQAHHTPALPGPPPPGEQPFQCSVEVRTDISYGKQVELYATRFKKDKDWVAWMTKDEVRKHYHAAWEYARAYPTTVKGAFHYLNKPNYQPPWAGEQQHMDRLNKMAALAFPGMDFAFLFEVDRRYANVLLEVDATPGTMSIASPEGHHLLLHFETILHHEFGHVLALHHHYEETPVIPPPPGETQCVMARTSTEYCSGCRAATNLDLSAHAEPRLGKVIQDIKDRYPQGY